MATFLDVGLLNHFSVIIAFLFVLVFSYGILSFSHFFGQKKGLQILLAFLLALIVLIVPKMGRVFLVVTPWFVLLFIFLAFLMLAYRMFGTTDEDFHSVIKHEKGVMWTILSVVTIILLWGIVHVFGTPYLPGEGEETGEEIGSSTGFSGALGAVIFHPKVLGAVFILLLAVFVVGILAGETPEKHSGDHH